MLMIVTLRQLVTLGVKTGLAIGVIFFAAAKLFPAGLLSLFTNDQAVIAEGVRYLSVICWTYLLFSVSNSLMYALQSVEITGIGIVMSSSTICINLCLNYCLIYGNFGFPELGVVGAAVLSAFVFQFSPVVTFCCLKADQILKCLVNGFVCNRHRWARLLTREVSEGQT
ncbi:MAG: hypothetical protein LUG57_03160 [Oscillospiraceae bacterium]|nr:hypothetical protein [Oscillospiraceae bacterium]